jgi:hypothetical protein
MDCINHPGVAAVANCAHCGQPFCNSCLVPIQGMPYCGNCKSVAVSGTPMVEAAMMPCKEADDALKYAIIGLFCFGIILEPIAIVKANQAKKMLALNPRLTGSGKAQAAMIIAIVGLALWVLGLIVRFSGIAHS